MSDPRPCDPSIAVTRARLLLQSQENQRAGYVLGGGDWHPDWSTPWTTTHGEYGGDCRVAFLWCYQLPADRPGYNRAPYATVSDCINYNSLLEDAEHVGDLVERVTDAPREGDILAYPTIHLPGHPLPWIGHGAIVIGTSRAASWDPNAPQFHLLDIMQVCGPSGRQPAAIATDGAVFDHHSALWPKPEHTARLIRVKP